MMPLLLSLLASLLPAQEEDAYYRIETIPIPEAVLLEVGGMAWMRDGSLMVVTRRGEVWNRGAAGWKLFASGLQEPLGICVTGPGEVVVAQRPELTRLKDVDGDGRADLHETLTDAWAFSGHPYEWTFGPVRDRDGNFWGTLSCWFYPWERPSKPFSGLEIKPPSGLELLARPAWRGWAFKVTPRGEFVPAGSGLRSPNGIGISPAGEVFATDNQGEYLGACSLHHLSGEEDFHGHPAGLHWGPEARKDPFAVPLEELDRRRKPAAVLFPHGPMGQSAAGLAWDTSAGAFGPFAGQLFVGDQTKSLVMRVALEKVGGLYQGACFPFRKGFQSGNNRLLFSPDGSLFLGQTSRGWGAVGGKMQGLQRLVWTGREPLEIRSVELTKSGFELCFTAPVAAPAASDPASYSLQHYGYRYHRVYGSPQVDPTPVSIQSVRLSEDGRRARLEVGTLVPGRIYEFNLRGLKAEDGRSLLHPQAYYTLNRLKE